MVQLTNGQDGNGLQLEKVGPSSLYQCVLEKNRLELVLL